VSFPSTPPPSVIDQPALLPADVPWTPPPLPALPALPAPEPRPAAPPPSRPRRGRFIRPTIDIAIPQPPSESRAKRQREIWDVALSGEGAQPDDAQEIEAPEPEPTSAPRPPPSGAFRTSFQVRVELDTGPTLEALRTAASREEIVAAALRGLRTVGRRAAIFVVRRDGFHGWACNVELGDEEAIRRVFLPHDAPSVFATAVATGTYFGPIPGNAVHAGLQRVLDPPSSDVAIAAARAGGKPAMLLFADELVDIKRRVLPRLTEITDAASAALSRLVAARL
jgi:hypothetical protein